MMAATPGPSCSSRRTAPAVPQGTRLLTRIARPLRGQAAAPGAVIPPDMLDFDSDPALRPAVVFATPARTTVDPDHNELRFHKWGNARCCLPRGGHGRAQVCPPVTIPQPDSRPLFENTQQ